MRGMIAVVVLGSAVAGRATAGPVDEVPPAFAPFEHMVGGWKGTAKPAANPLKGWQESHGWAWKFEKGVPVGMSLEFRGDKSLGSGRLTFDAATKAYHLDGLDAGGKPVRFVGTMSPDGKALTLDRVGETADGKERLIVRPNSNKIRYTFQLDRQEKGAPQFKKAIEVGLTKDGESFAAGGGESNLPKCILTGGVATMTVTYMGKTFPVCCTGCRDEFNDNPAKYAAKATATAGAEPATTTAPTPAAEATPAKAAAKGKAAAAGPVADAKASKAKDDPEAKAARALNLAQNLERNGKKALALEQYRKVVKDFPTTEAAKSAATKAAALEPR